MDSVPGQKGKGKRKKRVRQLATENTRWQPVAAGITRSSDPMAFLDASEEAWPWGDAWAQ